jgi:glycosyltransferase involved in cell wall biosynthesis
VNVLLIGDGIAIQTGFAQVLRQVAQECVQRGHTVYQLACMDTPPRCDPTPYRALRVEPFFPCRHDQWGQTILDEALDGSEPDCIFINCDPGTTALVWKRLLSAKAPDVPVVLYAPVEGAPIAPDYASSFAWAQEHGMAFTYTQWASDELKTAATLDVPYLHHGVDPELFKPLKPADRERVRAQLGWTDRFVVLYVARNAARKAHDRAIKALRHLKDGFKAMSAADALVTVPPADDYLLYLHCSPFDDPQLQGGNLYNLAHWMDVERMVEFPRQRDPVRGERAVSLAQKYAAADLYIHPAKVEGFGLPLLEAMASGLPVICPMDRGNMQEVVGPAALLLDPADWDTWFNGAQLALLEPRQLAWAIYYLREHPELRAEMRKAAQQRAAQFSWQTMRAGLVDAIEEVVAERSAPHLTAVL